MRTLGDHLVALVLQQLLMMVLLLLLWLGMMMVYIGRDVMQLRWRRQFGGVLLQMRRQRRMHDIVIGSGMENGHNGIGLIVLNVM